MVAHALHDVIGLLSPDTVAMLMQMLIDGQETNITHEDIAQWSAAGLNLDADNPIMSAPGLETAAMATADTTGLSINTYQNNMLTYDSEVVAQQIQAFLYGE